MDPETQRLINLLKAILRMLGLSHREVARRLEMSPSYLSKLFSGVSEIRLDHIIRICRAAEIEPAEFFSLAYPRQPAGSSFAARQLRALMQQVQPLPPSPRPSPAPDDEKQVEEMFKAMVERVLGRRGESV